MTRLKKEHILIAGAELGKKVKVSRRRGKASGKDWRSLRLLIVFKYLKAA